ncbi:unnamed protein product [Durusdinium trenchii]|uniref:Uncharacterized protein n=1 Tax=Durusdinium trenchii TaxID=1381693 RepID=A0ABP0I6J6_9DINO
MRLLSLLWLCWTQRTTHTAAANALGAAVDVEDGALLVVRPDGHDEHLWSCAFVAEGDALRCWDTTPPPVFRVRFRLKDDRRFVLKVTSSWAPVFAQRFWQLSKLNWWKDVPIYRPCYTNKTQRFVSQFGLVGSPKVNKAWIDQKTSNATAPALVSNTRGRLSFSMDAVMCNASAAKDPCAKYRPNCTATDYCAVGWYTEIFVNYQDNSHLDSHGFAPFAEVEEGMEVLDHLGSVLGNLYGEVQELCTPNPDPFCRFRDGLCQGVNSSTLIAEGNVPCSHSRSMTQGSSLDRSNEYIRSGFPKMYDLRIAGVEEIIENE